MVIYGGIILKKDVSLKPTTFRYKVDFVFELSSTVEFNKE